MCDRRVALSIQPQSVIKNRVQPSYTSDKIVFSFIDFHLKPINIKNQFNNHFKDQNDYLIKMTNLLTYCFNFFSNESVFSITTTKTQKTVHFHQIKPTKHALIKAILEEYQFNEEKISSILEGANIYQFESPNLNGSLRIVGELIGNTFSVLFIDVNHHIYLNKTKMGNSLFYEHCPRHINGECPRMDYFGTCYCFDYLDEDKFIKSYDCSHSIVDYIN